MCCCKNGAAAMDRAPMRRPVRDRHSAEAGQQGLKSRHDRRAVDTGSARTGEGLVSPNAELHHAGGFLSNTAAEQRLVGLATVFGDSIPCCTSTNSGDRLLAACPYMRQYADAIAATAGAAASRTTWKGSITVTAAGSSSVGQPLLECALGASFDHVERPCRSGLVADRSRGGNHGDVLVAAAGVPPHVFIDPDRRHDVEPGRIGDQDSRAFDGSRVAGPGDA